MLILLAILWLAVGSFVAILFGQVAHRSLESLETLRSPADAVASSHENHVTGN